MLFRLLRTSTRRRPSLPPCCRRSTPNFCTETPHNLKNPQQFPSPPSILHNPKPSPPPLLFPLPSRSSKTIPLYILSGTLVSTLGLAALLYSSSSDEQFKKTSDRLYADLEQTLEKSKDSLWKVLHSMKQTGAAATVLWSSLASVLSSANHEVQKGFELRVAAFVADIVAANEGRRSAIVTAGGGTVVDWLLKTVATSGENGRDYCGTQAESARALAYLIADPNVCQAVLGRPHAIPYLLRFIFSFQPKQMKKHLKHGSLDGPDIFKGRSMLVAAIMDIITSNCDNIEQPSFRPPLPANADMGDIAAALEVIGEGGMYFDEHSGSENDDDGGKGMRGIGIKILGGASVLGVSRTNGLSKLVKSDDNHLDSVGYIPCSVMLQEKHFSLLKVKDLTSVSVPGLWDDLQREHVAVPFAAWALANWASASESNRSHIQDLDSDGHAVTAALTAQERTVKWHGSLVARVLVEDQNLPLTDCVSDWSFSLLSTVSQAIKAEDFALAQVALSAFLISVERSNDAKMKVMEKGLHLMRETARRMEKHRQLQEVLARSLELLCTGDTHLSFEESQKWSGVLLRWVFSKISSDATRLSAAKILSCMLEDYGPESIIISLGWLTILLSEILEVSKTAALEGSSPLKNDKVKTLIDQSNTLSAAQIMNQLANAVVNLAGNQMEPESDSVDRFPLDDFLSLNPFATLFKNLKKVKLPKSNSADSALATLKGIKALTELCAEDSTYQDRILDFGILCLLRRFLLRDDYEQLAAIEAYDASRVLETQERGSSITGEASSLDTKDPSSVRVPPTAHIRRHAARLLTILSLQPKVKKAIVADENLCQWLEECASGMISGCNDQKLRSYARATLLNSFCSDQMDENVVTDDYPDIESRKWMSKSLQYDDVIFLINPELQHWKHAGKDDLKTKPQDSSVDRMSMSPSDNLLPCNDGHIQSGNGSSSGSINLSDEQLSLPIMDIVFVHGLRGGPFKSWRVSDNKSSTTTKSGLVEKIDQEAGKQGTCWPREWLAADFPHARLFTVKYKTNITQWSGACLPLQEVSSMLLHKLAAAGIGDRPVVFVTHSMGGLVVKQMLYQAKMNNFNKFVNNTKGFVFYSCPHFGSKLADMPWRMGLVFRPAPTIGELRSGSPRLLELNEFLRYRHNKGFLEVLSFSETQVTPIVEGYGGWAFRMEVVPIESAYPGFGEIIVLDATDHINSCKPVNRTDPSYAKTLEFLQKLKDKLK